LPRTGRAQPRLDPGQRRARHRARDAARRDRRRRRLPALPHAHELHVVLPQGDRTDLFDRRLEARALLGDPEGRAQMTPVLFLVQRLSAAALAIAVAVHLVTILYAIRGGLTAGEILARTHGNLAVFAFYSLFVAAVAFHAPI